MLYPHDIPILLQSGAPKIAKLVYNSKNYALWYIYIYSTHGVYNYGSLPEQNPIYRMYHPNNPSYNQL